MKRKFDEITEEDYKKQIELLDLAQTNLRKVVSERVAKANHNLLISSVHNQEQPTSIESISTSIATSDIVSQYKQMLKPTCTGHSDMLLCVKLLIYLYPSPNLKYISTHTVMTRLDLSPSVQHISLLLMLLDFWICMIVLK